MPSTPQRDDFVIACETGDVNVSIYVSGHLFYWLLFLLLYSSTVFLSDVLCDPDPDKVIHVVEQRNESCILVLFSMNLFPLCSFCWS